MPLIRRSEDRGRTRFGWLDSRHSFSFGQYYDPRNMGFGALRVINDDVVAPASGFGMHPHGDMEILTVMLRGSLEHEDSMGNRTVLCPGDVQRTSAGTGILHSEINPSPDEATRFLQVWIEPESRGLAPSFDQRSFDEKWQLVASRDGRDGSLRIHQDADVHLGRIAAGESIAHALGDRSAWVHVVAGEVGVAGERLGDGDAVGVRGAGTLEITATEGSQVLLFDLA